MSQLKLSLLCLLVILFCGCGGRATLFVDNDSDDPVRVEIDGAEEIYVSSGNSAKCFVLYGDHQVTVKRSGKVVFQETKTFEPNEDGTSWRHYLLDPDADTRYAVREIEYFEDQEKANKSKSRRVKRLPKKHWVDVPNGATVLSPMPVVFTSSKAKSTKRLCVVAD